MRGKKRTAVHVRQEYIVWRNRYLHLLLQNRSLPDHERRLEVYVDKSYIHRHCNHFSDSTFDPTDTTARDPKLSQKGRRYCIYAAISGGGRKETYELVPNSIWTFCPNTRHGHKVDYHQNINSVNFIE